MNLLNFNTNFSQDEPIFQDQFRYEDSKMDEYNTIDKEQNLQKKNEAIRTQQQFVSLPDEIPITQNLNYPLDQQEKNKNYQNIPRNYKSQLMPKRFWIKWMRINNYKVFFSKLKVSQIKKYYIGFLFNIALSFLPQKSREQWLKDLLKTKEENWKFIVDFNQPIFIDSRYLKKENLKFYNYYVEKIKEVQNENKVFIKINRKKINKDFGLQDGLKINRNENFNDCREKIQQIKIKCQNQELLKIIEALEEFIKIVEDLKIISLSKNKKLIKKTHNINKGDLNELLRDDEIRKKLKEEIDEINKTSVNWDQECKDNWQCFFVQAHNKFQLNLSNQQNLSEAQIKNRREEIDKFVDDCLGFGDNQKKPKKL